MSSSILPVNSPIVPVAPLALVPVVAVGPRACRVRASGPTRPDTTGTACGPMPKRWPNDNTPAAGWRAGVCAKRDAFWLLGPLEDLDEAPALGGRQRPRLHQRDAVADPGVTV